MADTSDVRRIALGLPGAGEAEDRFAFWVENKGKRKEFVWVWLERKDPDGPRRPREDVVAVRVDGTGEKEALLASDPRVFFTEPHYNAFPAVLVRLTEIGTEELRELITDAWRIQAPRDAVEGFDAR